MTAYSDDCPEPEDDFSDLKALFVNATLKK